MKTRRSPRGAPLSVIATSSSWFSGSTPKMRAACSRGLPIVAVAPMSTGFEPWNRATRMSRRSTFATCEPKTPWYVCSSSTTT